jgi:phage FluMu protein Com
MMTPAGIALKEVRCARCGRLLMRWDMVGAAHVEVKCPRCQQMNSLDIHDSRHASRPALSPNTSSDA